jgi:hypothetical protein
MMNNILTPKSVFLEAVKAVGDAVEIFFCIAFTLTFTILICLLICSFLTLPVVIAFHLEVVPEFTGNTLFQNWLTITSFLWASFWVTAAYYLSNRLKKIKGSQGNIKC